MPTSPLWRTLGPLLPLEMRAENIEYLSSTFPWGYTAGTADFVTFFRDTGGRRLIIIVECKKGSAHDESVLQVLLYSERVLQTAFSSALEGARPVNGSEAIILPMVVAHRATRKRRADPRVAIPRPYSLRKSYLTGVSIKATVVSPILLTYSPPAQDAGDAKFRDAGGFSFEPLPTARVVPITWQPPEGAVGTSAEMDWLFDGSWRAARERVVS